MSVFSFSSALAAEMAAETGNEKSTYDKKQLLKLESTVMNQNLTLEKRIQALKKLFGIDDKHGRIKRTFCAWDPLGKAGPIATTIDDQKLRALHYGMDLNVIIFQNEAELIERFTTENSCDAILVRGASAMPFNKFTASIEAVGAFPERRHLQLLTQVMAKPAMAANMSNDKYTVMGVGTIGNSNLYLKDASLKSLTSLKNKSIAVQEIDKGMIEVLNELGAKPKNNDLMSTVQMFANKETQAMVVPTIGYLIIGSGQLGKEVVAIKQPMAQSTIQLIGHTDRFQHGLDQILREDFLFKFDTYARRLDKEISSIPANFWIKASSADNQKLEQIYQTVRIKLRDQGYYDASMLRLARKIRCRFGADNDECSNLAE